MLRLIRVRVLLGVFAVLFALGSGYRALHTAQGLNGARRDATLASSNYRGAIVDVEAVLFSSAPIRMEDRLQLARAIDRLRGELDAREHSDLSRFSSRELGTLADMARGLGPLQGDALDRVRRGWMRIRSNLFDDAAWFRFSETDPVAAREDLSGVLSPADRATLSQLEAALPEVEALIERGEAECDRLGEPLSDSEWEAQSGPAFAQAWLDWGERWTDDVQRVRAALPAAPPAGGSDGIRFVQSSLDRALDELASIPRDADTRWRAPLPTDRDRRFQNAAKQARDAHFWIDRTRRGLGV